MPFEPEVEQPLRNKSALLVCSPLKAPGLIEGLKSLGAVVLPLQAIDIRPLENTDQLDSALRSLEQYDLVIFTSSYAVRHFVRRMAELGVPIERAGKLRTCAIGPATAAAAEECGITVSILPQEFVAEGVLEELARRAGGLQGLRGQKILLPRAKDAREILPRKLRDAGAQVDVAPCYETVQAAPDGSIVEEIKSRPPDLLIFTSSSNVTNFAVIAGADDARRILQSATVAVLGPITARTVESYGKRPEILPEQSTIPSLLAAIRLYFRNSRDRLRDSRTRDC
jgi:uroporphyrinogen III methyltransferase/synthase